MNGVNQRGILSFFQNVSSQRTKSKNNIVSSTKHHNENNNINSKNQDLKSDDIILITDEQVESEETHQNEAGLDQKIVKFNRNKNVKDPKEKTEALLSRMVEEIDSKEYQSKTERTVSDTSTKNFTISSSLENEPGENLNREEDGKENKREDVISKSFGNASKDLMKKKQLEEEKELKRLKREQQQLLIKQKREEERQRREQVKEEERRKREEEKRRREQIREEEKRKRKQIREEERRRREEMKRAKEEERLRKENEKRAKQEAKDRSQLRIGNFFKKSLSENIKPVITKSDYERVFRPFYAKDNIIISNIPTLPQDKLETKKQYIDNQLSNQDDHDENLCYWIKSKRVERGHKIKFKAVTLLQQMTTKEKTDKELQTMLSLIPQKYIKFYENVRPPFIGTYSKDFVLPVSKPFCTDVADYNYDYDSDLEWVNGEDEEGDGAGVDNLESGEEEEDDDDDDDEESEGEFDGFLDADDANNENQSKKKIIGPLIPIVHLRGQLDQLDSDDREYFKNTCVQALIENLPLPIDPSQVITVQKSLDKSNSTSPIKKSSSGEKRTINEIEAVVNDGSIGSKKPKTLITDSNDLLKLFNEIHGSTFSLGTVTEIAQKGLPQYNKLTIKNTVREYATRVNSKVDSSRKWEINDIEFWEKLKSNAV